MKFIVNNFIHYILIIIFFSQNLCAIESSDIHKFSPSEKVEIYLIRNEDAPFVVHSMFYKNSTNNESFYAYKINRYIAHMKNDYTDQGTYNHSYRKLTDQIPAKITFGNQDNLTFYSVTTTIANVNKVIEFELFKNTNPIELDDNLRYQLSADIINQNNSIDKESHNDSVINKLFSNKNNIYNYKFVTNKDGEKCIDLIELYNNFYNNSHILIVISGDININLLKEKLTLIYSNSHNNKPLKDKVYSNKNDNGAIDSRVYIEYKKPINRFGGLLVSRYYKNDTSLKDDDDLLFMKLNIVAILLENHLSNNKIEYFDNNVSSIDISGGFNKMIYKPNYIEIKMNSIHKKSDINFINELSNKLDISIRNTVSNFTADDIKIAKSMFKNKILFLVEDVIYFNYIVGVISKNYPNIDIKKLILDTDFYLKRIDDNAIRHLYQEIFQENFLEIRTFSGNQ